ncbi:MAG: UDP-N-acetylmuramoyl-tripeptide--D-alanyl-D-alanine ligase [Xanthomonadales bacterium]|nr:UDP-N-acetylmuramoyl-tripeptide--D-alanyl-D-alanine ligase [Xanthomonadales bacterium]
MKILLRKSWDALQPALRKPRWWVAGILRSFLWRTTVVAITGSNGKTTATRYLAAILSTQAPTQWTRLNRNSQGGITETIAFCRPWKTRYAVFEVGFGELGSIRRAARLIRPHLSVVLSVLREHRLVLKSLETTAREKAELIAGLPENGVAVLNTDDPWVAKMPVPQGRTSIRVGASPGNDVWYENAESAWPHMLRFTAVVDGARQEIRTRMLGVHWIGSILPCIAVAHHLGVPLEEIARVIEEVPPYPARMQPVRLPSGAVVIRDEFKGTRHTVDVAFDELRRARASRKFLVFGDLWQSALEPRERLGEVGREAAELFDYAIFIGDNARYGMAGSLKGGLAQDRARAFPDYQSAARFLKPLLGPGDVVLTKADRNNQLSRLFYSLLGEVRCTIPLCDRPMVCDDCREFRNPELVQQANEQLSVRVD